MDDGKMFNQEEGFFKIKIHMQHCQKRTWSPVSILLFNKLRLNLVYFA